ncbi:hypothetical protein DRP53_07765 [candidate division WOR-3 bacterium]|uniref:Gingipain domain-containing protein n=1 Tax=candidate division WOR-3 bacterium TaxID=2052148 RepID=A0A660SFV1_UNCW3|nr:MAG: hypothetical protein DRP53_07765 [candidate division WOR-3 bacterium]
MRITAILIMAIPLIGGTIVWDFHFPMEDLSFTTLGEYTLVTIGGANQLIQPGYPTLPAPSYHFVIPPDAEVEAVDLLEHQTVELPGRYLLYPGQPSQPPDPVIYGSEYLYPEEDLKFSKSGLKGGFRIFSLALYPLHYQPKNRRLILSRRMRVRIRYREGVHHPQTITERQYQIQRRAVRSLVINRDDVDRFHPLIRPNSINDVNYAIVTGGNLVDYYQPFADWKTKKGYLTKVFSTTWIYASYPGRDNPEKIRNFFRDYYQNKGLIWALLGGDVQIVPERDIYSTYYQPYYIASDWYYWDLDSNWNRNGNNRYGELGDVLPSECYYDIYGGRDPIDDSSDIIYFTDKLFTFEKNPPDTGINTIVLVSADTTSMRCNEVIAQMFPPWWRIVWVIEAQAPATRETLNTYQPQFCHLVTHGDRNGFYAPYGQPIFTEADIPYLTNDLPTIFNAIAGYTGEFDNRYDDCIGEELINFQKGGMATMFNSRYAFGGPPALGPCEQLDTAFYHMVCYTDTLWLGVAFAAAHEHFADLIWTQGLWHYCGLEQNLMGEPEMGLYLKRPGPIQIAFPETIEAKPQSFTVTVADSAGPLANALVCCYKDGELHETGWTDESGRVTLNISPQTEGIMFVTASCFNHLPEEDTCIVTRIGITESPPSSRPFFIIPTVVKGRLTIYYSLPTRTRLRLTLIDILGRNVAQIYDGELEGEGELAGGIGPLPAGIYYLRITGERSLLRRIVVIR